ncbi:hypothetical protein PG991_013373 [Apiospora marii]|uniref:2EXR domain-containing protein n=2 Tax=Apiospora marii TaxID=335849 RepID=A0ABR1R5V2_9PEZI
MDRFMDLMESFKLFFDPEVDEYGTEFQPFSRLPTELRLKIWRANWEPKAIWPQNALYAPGDPGYPPPQANLPVTARINQESRDETLRMYRKISHMGLHIFRSYFNIKIDTLHLDAEPFHFEELDPHNRYLEACPAPICSALDYINLLKIERLDLSSSDYIPETI